jgi:hypothetical protein
LSIPSERDSKPAGKKLTLGSAMALFPVIASLKKGAQLTIFDFFGLRPCKK